jgi:hypothetical protein
MVTELPHASLFSIESFDRIYVILLATRGYHRPHHRRTVALKMKLRSEYMHNPT